MDNCICNFYVGATLHKLEVLASPFSNVQEVYLDDKPVIREEGKAVNGYMVYSLTVDQMPLYISIHDCGFGCDFNVYLNDTSILDGTKLDVRKREAERLTQDGFFGFLKYKLLSYISASWLLPIITLLTLTVMCGFELLALCAVVLAYPVALVALCGIGYARQKSVIAKWQEQFQRQ